MFNYSEFEVRNGKTGARLGYNLLLCIIEGASNPRSSALSNIFILRIKSVLSYETLRVNYFCAVCLVQVVLASYYSNIDFKRGSWSVLPLYSLEHMFL